MLCVRRVILTKQVLCCAGFVGLLLVGSTVVVRQMLVVKATIGVVGRLGDVKHKSSSTEGFPST